MRWRKLPRCVLAAAMLTWPASGGRAEDDKPNGKRPNILFLLTDDQRPDTIAALGNDVIVTPALDSLVRSGMTFTRAYCGNPICTPSRAEILTGCSGFRNGVLDFGGPIKKETPLWAGTLQDAGYATWYVGKWHNDGRPTQRGYSATNGLFAGGGGLWAVDQTDYRGVPVTGYRGWVFQNDDGEKFPEKGVGLTPDISAKFADAAIEVIERADDRPFFLHVNFTAPHDPLYFPPGYEDAYSPEEIPVPRNFLSQHPFDHGNFDGRDEKLLPWPRTPNVVQEDLAGYYAVISHLDEQIGRIVDALEKSGKRQNTLIVFSSDHGLAMGSHGLRGKQSQYEHTAKVPLVIAGPGIEADQRNQAMVYLRDLFPTTCEMAGVEVPDSVEGRSFANALRGETSQGHERIHGYFRDSQRMVRDERYKLIHYPKVKRTQLFDLLADPEEIHDLSDSEQMKPIKQKLQRQLEQWFAAQGDAVYAR